MPLSRTLVAALVAGGILYLARPVLPPFVIAALFAYILAPAVRLLRERTGLPRIAIVLGLYLLLLALLAVGVWFFQAAVRSELVALFQALPQITHDAAARVLGSQDEADALVDALVGWLRDTVGDPSGLLHVAERVLDSLFKAFVALVALFYLLLDGARLGPYLLKFVEEAHRPRVAAVALRINQVLGRYIRGQLFLIVLMSTVTYGVLAGVFRLPFALPLALMTGVFEVVPFVGPVVAGAIASIIALVHLGVGGMVGVALAYFVLRQLEDQLVMPQVLGRAVDLHPLTTIVAVLVGGAVAGVLGALLAVPAAAALKVAAEYLLAEPES